MRRTKLYTLVICIVLSTIVSGCRVEEAAPKDDISDAFVQSSSETELNNVNGSISSQNEDEEVEPSSLEDQIDNAPIEDTVIESVEEGHKRPVSISASKWALDKKMEDYNSEIEFYDDNSYCIKVSEKQYDYYLYFTANGILKMSEIYEFSQKNPDGKLQRTNYYLFGAPLGTTGFFGITSIRELNNIIPEYDSEGNIINESYMPEEINGELNLEAYVIERDNLGRITKMTENKEDTSWGLRLFEFKYDPNAVQILGWKYYPDQYDNNTRTMGTYIFEDGIHIILNDRKQPIELQHLENEDRNGGFIYDQVAYYEYDQNGYLTSVSSGNYSKRFDYSY